MEQKAEMEAVSSYEWMRALQTNMESDTMARRKSTTIEAKKVRFFGPGQPTSFFVQQCY